MAESAASAFLNPVFELLGSKIVKEFELVWGVKEELDKLSSYLSAIQSVLQDAEEKQIQSNQNQNQVRDWMRKLKDVAWDAEDVLDEFATEASRSKLLEEDENQTSKWKRVYNSFFSCLGLKSLYEDENQTSKWKQVCNSFFSCLGLKSLYEHENPLALKSLQFRREISHKIKDINEKLERIATEKNNLNLHLRHGGGDGDGGSRLSEVIRKKPKTISLVHESDVLGRDNDKKKLIDLLVSDGSVSKEELSVIPIVGMGGLGKTTLAQLIYNDENVKKHFELKGWVCVSDDFDLERLSKAIIENITGESSNYGELTSLTEKLQKIVSGKKFLLVLDDVWNEDRNHWEILRAPLRCGAKGSKIIVTTRSEKVSQIMGTMSHNSLNLLSDEDCLLLLGKWAFPTEGTWDEHQDLVAVGKKIAKKCRGLPLAVKTLGGLLQGTKEETKWNDILRSEIWKLRQGGKYDILPALRLSYHHLPSHLKQCFRYCSIFPKNYLLDKDELVNLWMAEGFITSEVGQRAMEDVGSDYFDDLLWRSFFQQYEVLGSRFVCYKMHDLIHDLAESLSEGECFRKEGDKLNHFFEKARYSSFITHDKNDLTIYLQCERLHTLLLLESGRAETISFPTNLFLQMKFLRVLDLRNAPITELPDSIGNLKHLRYLNLSNTKVQRLPESVSSLHNLQTLDLSWCSKLVELPKDTRNLINLRHLIFQKGPRINSTPKGIGGLTCLRTLTNFIVGKENGHEVGQLMKLINLRGQLKISGLENVVNAEDAILKNKEYIEELNLSWRYLEDDDAMDPSVAEKVLERLQPYHNLRILNISNYNGERFPSWIGHPSFSKLVDVTLRNCTSCKTLPPLWQLPSLRKFELWGGGFTVDGIMVTKVVFPSLEKLIIRSLPNLVEWRGSTEEEEDFFPCLGELEIYGCESLIALPRFLTSVRQLSLDKCNERILSSLSYFTSLSSLTIDSCENLKVIPCGSFKNLKALKDLSIYRCKELVSLVEDDEGDYKYLVSLQRMSIGELPKLTFLPDGLKNLISLKELNISNCKGLATLPKEGLPTTLQTLNIKGCPLLAEQCKRESGEYWPKISYIPNLNTVFSSPRNLWKLLSRVVASRSLQVVTQRDSSRSTNA